MQEPKNNRNNLLAYLIQQGAVPDAQDYMMPGGNLGPSASGRANPSWGPLDYMGIGIGGVGGGAIGAMGAIPLAALQAITAMTPRAANRGAAAFLGGGAATGGAIGAREGLRIADEFRMDRQTPQLGPYSPQVPQEYAYPSYDDGTMYGAGDYPVRRR